MMYEQDLVSRLREDRGRVPRQSLSSFLLQAVYHDEAFQPRSRVGDGNQKLTHLVIIN